MSVSRDELLRKYAGTDDPWNFRRSAYEQAKFAATRAALSRPGYRAGLELGCGNGALAQHLAPACGRYVGLDAVPSAIASARKAAPAAEFVEGWIPDDLPDGDFDLIVLSEILYFLDPSNLRLLARAIEDRWPKAELVCVTWRGDTGHELQGEQALSIFDGALSPERRLSPVVIQPEFRIDHHVTERDA